MERPRVIWPKPSDYRVAAPLMPQVASWVEWGKELGFVKGQLLHLGSKQAERIVVL